MGGFRRKRKRLLDLGIKIFAASDDLKARGYVENYNGVDVVNYERIVEVLMEESDQIITL